MSRIWTMSSPLRAELRAELDRLFAAIGFLTRLPVPRAAIYDPAWLVRSAKYFPLVGTLIGAIGAAILVTSGAIWSGGLLPALLATAVTILVTGALHEDGLADTADAFGGGTREARLAIMKDSRLGTFGALALGLSLAVRVGALAALAPDLAAWALVASHAGSRLATVLGMAMLPHAGDAATSRISYSPDRLQAGEIAVAAVLAILPMLPAEPRLAFAGLLAGGAAAVILALLMFRRLGGYTGDVLGAIEQVFQVGFLLGVAAVAR
jgi:adenosylcobinamide-GDP ribazoletransferase